MPAQLIIGCLSEVHEALTERHWSAAGLQQVFLLLLQALHVQIAVIFEPRFVGLGTQRPDQRFRVSPICASTQSVGPELLV